MAVNRDKTGKFLPGTPPPAGVGRPAGSTNRITASLREVLAARTSSRIDRLFDELDDLQGKEYVQAVFKLLDYFIPRPQAITIDRVSTVEELIKIV